MVPRRGQGGSAKHAIEGMRLLSNLGVKRARRIVVLGIFLVPALYFLPVPTIIIVLCGVLDVGRHRRIRSELIEKYFFGNGIPTWLLSPINLLVDLFSYPNLHRFKLADLPEEHRTEIQACVRAFVDNRDLIKAHIADKLAHTKRAMLTFKWYNAPQTIDLRIPAFERNYRFIKTIAVSVFNTRERTSWHYGPLRLTFRVLYNLDPVDSRDVFIEVDDQVHYWIDDPLFIFDDTVFHRSINDVDHVRYCLFMDIVRPNYSYKLFDMAVHAASVISGSFKRIFYKNWSFVR
jgi:aspartyl/asparaginyl beta-hydroxylase (cupin superfamily)